MPLPALPLSFAWLGAVQWKKLLLKALPYIVAVAALVGTCWYIYSSGSKSGAASVQSKWDKQQLEQERANTQRRIVVAGKESVHSNSSQRITDELATANQKHAATVAAINSNYARRVRLSEERAAHYKHLSEAGAAESANLADHAAKLDRSLEEGRQLVQELGATVRQRDAQIRALGQQILTDRALVGEKDGTDSTSAE